MLLKPQETLLFTGDSVTDCGRNRPVGSGYAGGLGTAYPAYVCAALSLDYPDQDFNILNTAISGDTTRRLLDRWDSDVLAYQPAVLSILIGINDVWRQFGGPGNPKEFILPGEFEANYQELLRQSRPVCRRILLLTPFFMELHSSDPMRAMVNQYADIVRRLAMESDQYILVDTQKAFDQLLQKRHYMTLASDRVHPNATGHLLIARWVQQALETAD